MRLRWPRFVCAIRVRADFHNANGTATSDLPAELIEIRINALSGQLDLTSEVEQDRPAKRRGSMLVARLSTALMLTGMPSNLVLWLRPEWPAQNR